MNLQEHSDESSRDQTAPNLANVVEENIDTIIKMRRAEQRDKGPQEHTADALTKFSGSMIFVYVHAIWFALWIALNVGWLGAKPFDPFPFSLLTLIVSLEAIFLSTFVLISENRASRIADKRAELDLQINLLSEYEITRLLTLMDAIADHLGVDLNEKPELQELKKDISAEAVLKRIQSRLESEAIEK